MMLTYQESKLIKTHLCSILRDEWPRSIHAISYLETCDKWIMVNPNFCVSVHCIRGLLESGIFVSILYSGCVYPVMTMYALDSYMEKFDEVMNSLPLQWTEPMITLSAIPLKLFPIIERVIIARGYKVLYATTMELLTIDEDAAKNLEIICPAEVEIRALTIDALLETYRSWPLNELYYMNELQSSFEYNAESAFGVYCRASGHLLSRCLRVHDGSIACLYTVPTASQKGYATLLLKYVAKHLTSLSITPYAYVSEHELVALKTFQAAGYHVVDRVKMSQISKVQE